MEQIFAGDFDGDGKLDIVVNHPGAAPDVLEVLSGNGDGTFTAKAARRSVTYMTGVGMGDLNGDGRPDFGGALDQRSNNVVGLIGNGDGTFTPSAAGTDSWQLPQNAVVADFTGAGYGEIAIANQQNGVTIMLPQATGTATAVLSGVSVVGTGTHYADAVYPGDASYTGAPPISFRSTLSLSPLRQPQRRPARAGRSFLPPPSRPTRHKTITPPAR